MSRKIATLDNYRHQESDEDDDESREHFYAGGSDRSGQEIVGPPGGNILRDNILDDVISAAKGNADRYIDQDSDRRILYIWRDGFSVDDGPLRLVSDPSNQQFLKSIAEGRIPYEFMSGDAKRNECGLQVVDRRPESFPKQPVQAFSGQGRILGSPTSKGSSSQKSLDENFDIQECERAAKACLKVDETQPTGKVQVRLPDGGKLLLTVNPSLHTVLDIRHYIAIARPSLSMSIYTLHSGYPSKEISDENLTVREAGLINAVVSVHVK